MMLGTPVLSSNTSSIPEIAGTAAVLVDPYDGHAIAEGIRAIDSDAALRMDMIARGFDQAERFSAEAYQRRLDGVYGRFIR
jgi:glycosyltransferase involved in cell wall biosynthesis